MAMEVLRKESLELPMEGIFRTPLPKKPRVPPITRNPPNMGPPSSHTKYRAVKYFSSSRTKRLHIKIPKREVEVHQGTRVVSSPNYKDMRVAGSNYGIVLKKGDFRKSNEDRFSVFPSVHGGAQMFALFDGHAGHRAAQHASEVLLPNLAAALSQYSGGSNIPYQLLLKNEIMKTNNEFSEIARVEKLKDGSTVLAAIIESGMVTIGNLGDSSGYLFKCGESQEHLLMNSPHRPEIERERAYIYKRGGHVLGAGHRERLQGVLSVSRSIGDIGYTHLMNPEVDIYRHSTCGWDFLVLGSDGLWDYVSAGEVGDFLSQSGGNGKCEELAEGLVKMAYTGRSKDNVTVMVIALGGGGCEHMSTGDIYTQNISPTPKKLISSCPDPFHMDTGEDNNQDNQDNQNIENIVYPYDQCTIRSPLSLNISKFFGVSRNQIPHSRGLSRSSTVDENINMSDISMEKSIPHIQMNYSHPQCETETESESHITPWNMEFTSNTPHSPHTPHTPHSPFLPPAPRSKRHSETGTAPKFLF